MVSGTCSSNKDDAAREIESGEWRVVRGGAGSVGR